MQLNEVLTTVIKLTESADAQVYELKFDASIRDFKLCKDGVIVSLKDNTNYGTREALLKWAMKANPHASPLYLNKNINTTDKYVMRTYQCDATKKYLEEKLQYFNEDQVPFSIISIKPYPKLVNHTTVTVIHPASWDDKKMSSQIKYERKIWDRSKNAYVDRDVKFFSDTDAEADFDVTTLPEFKIMKDSFNDVTPASLLAKGTYKFIVDPEYNGSAKLAIVIHGNGYVRKDDGVRPQVIQSPEGATEAERKANAWKAAVKWCKKHKLM